MTRYTPEPPHVCAFLLCDHAWSDPRSGKWHVQGVFDAIEASEFPLDLGPVAVYLNLTNLRGPCRLELQFLLARDEIEFADARFIDPFERESPLERFESAVDVEDLEIPEPGTYLIRLVANGRDVQDVVFSVSHPGNGS